MFEEMTRDTGKAAAAAAPPVTVATATIAGFGLQEWVYILTIVYLAAQIGWLFWRWFLHAMVKRWRAKRA